MRKAAKKVARGGKNLLDLAIKNKAKQLLEDTEAAILWQKVDAPVRLTDADVVAMQEQAAQQKAVAKAREADSVAIEAIGGVYGAKQEAYGDSIDNHERIAAIANTIKDTQDQNHYTAEQCCMVLVALKLARIQLHPHRDSFVDLVGYAEIWHRIKAAKGQV